MGIVYNRLANYEKAINYHEQSLIIWREIKDRSGEGVALSELVVIYKQLDNYIKAIETYEKIMLISREIGDKRNECWTLSNLGGV